MFKIKHQPITTKNIDINSLKVYYINLDRRYDRNISVINQLNKSNLLKNLFIKFRAIDGKNLKNIPQLNYFEQKKGWIGCAYSHINLWKEACYKNKNYLIFEDDIFLKKNFDLNFKKILNNVPVNFDMIYLLTTNYAKKVNYDKYFYKLTDKNFLLNGYLISPKGACKLLKKITPYNPEKQIDSWIVENTRNGYLDNYLIKIPTIWTFQDIDSDVQTNLKKKKYHGI